MRFELVPCIHLILASLARNMKNRGLDANGTLAEFSENVRCMGWKGRAAQTGGRNMTFSYLEDDELKQYM
jgi:hypothetical protein